MLPVARRARGPDAAAVRFHDPLGDGEAEPGAQAGGLPGLPVGVEDLGQVLGGDAGPGVRHRHHHLPLVVPPRGHGDVPALAGELERVADQVRPAPGSAGACRR